VTCGHLVEKDVEMRKLLQLTLLLGIVTTLMASRCSSDNDDSSSSKSTSAGTDAKGEDEVAPSEPLPDDSVESSVNKGASNDQGGLDASPAEGVEPGVEVGGDYIDAAPESDDGLVDSIDLGEPGPNEEPPVDTDGSMDF
jgi:hypothetical protein